MSINGERLWMKNGVFDCLSVSKLNGKKLCELCEHKPKLCYVSTDDIISKCCNFIIINNVKNSSNNIYLSCPDSEYIINIKNITSIDINIIGNFKNNNLAVIKPNDVVQLIYDKKNKIWIVFTSQLSNILDYQYFPTVNRNIVINTDYSPNSFDLISGIVSNLIIFDTSISNINFVLPIWNDGYDGINLRVVNIGTNNLIIKVAIGQYLNNTLDGSFVINTSRRIYNCYAFKKQSGSYYWEILE